MIVGPAGVRFREIVEWICGNAQESARTILLYSRLPRTLGCIVSGSALAVSGLLLQTALMNPLASPGIIGVNSGAGLFVVLAASFLPPLFWIREAVSFAGALTATLLILLIAVRTGASKTTVILSGAAISSLLSALIDAIISIYPGVVADRTQFLIGGFSSVSLSQILAVVPVVIITILASQFLAKKLDLLLLGDEVAASLGLDVKSCRFLAILCSAILASSAVSIAGLLGFVGLVVPHIARNLTGNSMRVLLPATMLLGICLMLLCDIISRVLFAPYELSAGIPLSVIGAPFFLWLILKRKRRQHD